MQSPEERLDATLWPQVRDDMEILDGAPMTDLQWSLVYRALRLLVCGYRLQPDALGPGSRIVLGPGPRIVLSIAQAMHQITRHGAREHLSLAVAAVALVTLPRKET